MPQCPEDLATGGVLTYQITGVEPPATFTVSINGGLMTAVSDADNRVTFTGIDVTNPLYKTIGLIEIVDANGCSSGMIDDVVFTFDSVYQYDVVNFSASNIDCTTNTSGNLGDFPKVPQNSPKVPQKNYQILPMIVGIVFCSFRLFYIFTYLYVLCIAFLQN